jgi:hypothetical protein
MSSVKNITKIVKECSMEMSMRGTRFTFYPWKSHAPINSGGGRGGNFSVLMEGVPTFLICCCKNV